MAMVRESITLTSILLCFSFLLLGCATSTPSAFNITIDSIGSASPAKQSYFLLPGDKNVNGEDLQFKEYVSYVNYALTNQGFVPAESFEKANIGIFLNYGISGPQESRISTSLARKVAPTLPLPDYVKRTTYSRYMILEAVDLVEYRTTGKTAQLWKTTVTSTGSSGDLRRVFPVLVVASSQYIATNTGQRINVVLDETDEQILEIRRIVKEKTNNLVY